MDKLKKAIESIGRDIGTLQANQGGALQTSKAYELFPTYATLQAQMTTNIKEKHVDLGLDALIDTKLQNGGDPFITRSKLPTIDTSQLATKNDLEELKRSVGSGASGSGELKGQGFPYELNPEIGTTYIDTTAKNGAFKWIKKRAGAGRDNWVILAGDTGQVRAKNVYSVLGASPIWNLDGLIQQSRLTSAVCRGAGLGSSAEVRRDISHKGLTESVTL